MYPFMLWLKKVGSACQSDFIKEAVLSEGICRPLKSLKADDFVFLLECFS